MKLACLVVILYILYMYSTVHHEHAQVQRAKLKISHSAHREIALDQSGSFDSDSHRALASDSNYNNSGFSDNNRVRDSNQRYIFQADTEEQVSLDFPKRVISQGDTLNISLHTNILARIQGESPAYVSNSTTAQSPKGTWNRPVEMGSGGPSLTDEESYIHLLEGNPLENPDYSAASIRTLLDRILSDKTKTIKLTGRALEKLYRLRADINDSVVDEQIRENPSANQSSQIMTEPSSNTIAINESAAQKLGNSLTDESVRITSESGNNSTANDQLASAEQAGKNTSTDQSSQILIEPSPNTIAIDESADQKLDNSLANQTSRIMSESGHNSTTNQSAPAEQTGKNASADQTSQVATVDTRGHLSVRSNKSKAEVMADNFSYFGYIQELRNGRYSPEKIRALVDQLLTNRTGTVNLTSKAREKLFKLRANLDQVSLLAEPNSNSSAVRSLETKSNRTIYIPANKVESLTTYNCSQGGNPYCLEKPIPHLIEPHNICAGNHSIHLVMLITSSEGHMDRRKAIRSTWANPERMKPYVIRRVFLFGRQSMRLQAELENENLLYGDILQGDFEDTYRNLTLKTIMGYTWFRQNCPQAELLMKTDDDMFINTIPLLRFGEKNLRNRNTMAGYCDPERPRQRYSPDHRWYVIPCRHTSATVS